MKIKNLIICFCITLCIPLSAEEEWDDEEAYERLEKDLALARQITLKEQDQLPVIYNYLMQGGYFTMPSARMGPDGNLGLSFANTPPYYLCAGAFQLFKRIEIGLNYWIYRGIVEPNFGENGFGDDADRSANVKVALLQKGDGLSPLPELSIGWIDFIGTGRFNSFYVVATKSLLDWNLEVTAGWGHGRLQGFFGAAAWSPFRNFKSPFIKGFSLVAEYDANNYKKHPSEHPSGRKVNSKFNGGLHWNLFDIIHLSASSLRGKKLAAQAALTYNLGETKGFLPKIHNPLPYSNPIDHEPLGMVRSDKEFAYTLSQAFQEQGFDLYRIVLIPKKESSKELWLKVINVRYREEDTVRKRIQEILGALTPNNIDRVSVVMEADGIPSQEYVFRTEDLKRYQAGSLTEEEFRVIAPLKEARRAPSKYESQSLYHRRKSVWVYTFRPFFRSYFGSSNGKFKFDTGIVTGPEGYLFDQIYYSLVGSYAAYASSKGVGSVDTLNPSQIVNVRSDSILYQQTTSFHINQAYLQKSWNMTHGCFSRLAVGYFELAYAGVAGEFLYYPVQSNWAIGVSTAALLKRSYHGLGFAHKIRKFKGYYATYVPYYGLQYFLNFYYQFPPLKLDFKFSLGQFLAKDKGLRIDGGRTFSSGLRLGLWITFTNGNDHIGGSRYFDKGFSLTMPLDIFMSKSSRTRIGYAMAAWLRDVGAEASTGKELYDTLYFERFNSFPSFVK